MIRAAIQTVTKEEKSMNTMKTVAPQAYLQHADHMTVSDALAHCLAIGHLRKGEGSFIDQTAFSRLVGTADEEIKSHLIIDSAQSFIRIAPKIGMGATYHGWSDEEPYHIIEILSDRRVRVRQAKAEKDPTWSPDFRTGGFVGHVTNNSEQKWIITPGGEQDAVVEICCAKNGRWHDARSKELRFRIGYAGKYHDYNF